MNSISIHLLIKNENTRFSFQIKLFSFYNEWTGKFSTKQFSILLTAQQFSLPRGFLCTLESFLFFHVHLQFCEAQQHNNNNKNMRKNKFFMKRKERVLKES